MSAIQREPELSTSQQETEASCIDWINSINSTEVTCTMDLHDGLALAEFIGILSGKRVKVNKLVDRSDTIKQDNLVMCKDSWAARFPDWDGPVLPCEGFFLQNEVGLRDAIAFLHFCQLHVAPELVARGHRSRNKAAEEETESQMTLSKSSSKVYIDIKPLEGTTAPPQCPQGHTMEVSTLMVRSHKGPGYVTGYRCDSCSGRSKLGHCGGSHERWHCGVEGCDADICFECHPVHEVGEVTKMVSQ